MTDEELLNLYPFIKVDSEYNYIEDGESGLYTEKGLFLPEGWYNLFLLCCAELRKVLIEKNLLSTFKINQLKEKYGSMRIYVNISDEDINAIIERYEIISQFTCCICGKTATVETTGYVCPYCDECIKDVHGKTYPIDWIVLTKFTEGKSYRHYYTVYNLPFRPDSDIDSEYYMVAKDGGISIPNKWLEKDLIQEYVDVFTPGMDTVEDMAVKIEELLGK